MVEEEAHLSLSVCLVFHDNATQEDVVAIVNRIVERKVQLEAVILRGNVGDKRVVLVAQ